VLFISFLSDIVLEIFIIKTEWKFLIKRTCLWYDF
jgi:hypothetical protein